MSSKIDGKVYYSIGGDPGSPHSWTLAVEYVGGLPTRLSEFKKFFYARRLDEDEIEIAQEDVFLNARLVNRSDKPTVRSVASYIAGTPSTFEISGSNEYTLDQYQRDVINRNNQGGRERALEAIVAHEAMALRSQICQDLYMRGGAVYSPNTKEIITTLGERGVGKTPILMEYVARGWDLLANSYFRVRKRGDGWFAYPQLFPTEKCTIRMSKTMFHEIERDLEQRGVKLYQRPRYPIPENDIMLSLPIYKNCIEITPDTLFHKILPSGMSDDSINVHLYDSQDPHLSLYRFLGIHQEIVEEFCAEMRAKCPNIDINVSFDTTDARNLVRELHNLKGQLLVCKGNSRWLPYTLRPGRFGPESPAFLNVLKSLVPNGDTDKATEEAKDVD